jgi:hypothetical protein
VNPVHLPRCLQINIQQVRMRKRGAQKRHTQALSGRNIITIAASADQQPPVFDPRGRLSNSKFHLSCAP